MSFFFQKVHGKLKGLAGTYVDDSLFAGDQDFLAHYDKTSRKFYSKERVSDNFRFAGIYVESAEYG